MPRWPSTAFERFLANTTPEPNSGCLLWLGHTSVFGYGVLKIDGKDEQAHRAAFFFRFGRWPEPCGLHKCDTPPCVNVDHIYEGTRIDNMRDRDSRGRCRAGIVNLAKTHCPAGHPYSLENTRVEKLASGRTCRRCRICDGIRLSRRLERTPAEQPASR